jgi:peptidyl-prolyl cis-trans isomerase A (cyclophilin A)
MHTRILTTGLLLLALTACTEDKGKEATPAKAPEPAAAKTAEPPAAKLPETAAKPPETAAVKPPEPPAQPTPPPAPEAPLTGWQKAAMEGKDLYATLDTSMGKIVVKLFSKDAPKTVANFVGLASGEKEWKDPATLQMSTKPLYDGTIFHRIISGFMIQGGDPLGQGFGGPGYQFGDEFHPELSFDRPYLLAMANAGPGTNGSQFFITVGPTPHLNRKHTIFGEVADQAGRDVVDKIANVPTGRNDKPVDDVVIESVEVQRS